MPNSQAENLMETGYLPGPSMFLPGYALRAEGNASLSQRRYHQLSHQGQHAPAGEPVTGGLVTGCHSTEQLAVNPNFQFTGNTRGRELSYKTPSANNQINPGGKTFNKKLTQAFQKVRVKANR